MTQNEIYAVAAAYGIMSTLTAGMYGWDKLCAKRGWRRVPEMRLHLMALFCGWPGAWVAQQLFRHKSEKRSFRAVYAFTVLLNTLALGALLYALLRVDA